LGGQIREIHLLESPTVEKYITQYPEDGNNLVVKPKYENGKIFINDTQYLVFLTSLVVQAERNLSTNKYKTCCWKWQMNQWKFKSKS
jgi:hypothetical protein